jgi:UDP-MurNAc hydroxylase
MKLTNFGGATAILEHAGKRMLFDPWLDDGIFHGSWFHYPPLELGVQDLGRLDYVYISHIHEDHCSAGTIRHINPDAEIILMDRQPNLVARFLERHGFHFRKVHLLKPRTPLQLEPGLTVTIVEPDPADEMARLIDSSLLVRWDDFVVYNANDCLPYPAGMQYILDSHGKVDLALLPYSGGSGYPACYVNLSAEQKDAEKKRIVDMRLRSFADAVQFLQPTWAMPFADQYVIGGSRAHLNAHVSHPDSPAQVQKVLADGLTTKLLLLNSAQSFDFAEERKIPDAPYREFSAAERAEYIATELAGARYDHETFTFGPSVPLERLVQHARSQMWHAQQRQSWFPRFNFYLDITDTDRRFEIALDRAELAPVAKDAPCIEPYLRIAAPHSLMIMLLLGHVSWNIADAALFLDYERVPNIYDPKLFALLNYLRL